MRHAFEIRHESFRCQAFIDLLRAHDVALVCADLVAWPRLMDLTSDFVYCRLHGSEELYASGYDNAALDEWARRIKAWARGEEPEDAERVGGKARPRQAGRVRVLRQRQEGARAGQRDGVDPGCARDGRASVG